MGLTMAPATDSIMGALPAAKAGVGSAVNDTTRELGGALGVAVLGSVLSSVFGSRMGDVLDGTVPVDAAHVAQDSIGGAVAVAGAIGGETGQTIAAAARSAFVDGLHTTSLVAAGFAIAGALIALRFLPARATAEPDAGEEQGLDPEPERELASAVG
jgi:hypothetical protein